MPLGRRLTRAATAALLALAVTLSVVGPAAATPSVPRFGSAIDAYARYEGQTECLHVEQPGVRDFRALLQRTYGANTGGILRGCNVGGRSEHKEGRAYDWMLDVRNARDRAVADEFLSWLLATDEHGNRHAMARRFGVMYIIWNERIWSAYRPNQGWQPYTGASPHTDHIHFSFSWDGALRRTSYWTAQHPGGFPDVPSDSYYADPVRWMVSHEITDGVGDTGLFRPHREVTRAQMAAFLWRAMDRPGGHPAHGFPDVPSGAYYEPAVRWLKATGITDGVGDTGRFQPDRVLSRAEMATFLWRAAGSPTDRPRHTFPDVATSRYYDHAVSWLSAHRITDGYGSTGRFEPGLPVSRAQTSAFLHRFASDATAWDAAPTVPSTVTFPR